MPNNIEIEKSIDKSKNKLEIITDKNGHIKKVWKHVEGAVTPAGVNAGKSYEKTGKRHTEFEGFISGDSVSFIAGGKEISGVFRHVNQSKHSTVAVVRGEDGKLYERGLSKLSKKDTTKVVNKPEEKTPKTEVNTVDFSKVVNDAKHRTEILNALPKEARVKISGIIESWGNLSKQRQVLVGKTYGNTTIQAKDKELTDRMKALRESAAKIIRDFVGKTEIDIAPEVTQSKQTIKMSANTAKYLKVYEELHKYQTELDKKDEYPGISSKKQAELEKKIKVLKIQERTTAGKITKNEYDNFIPAEINQTWEDFRDVYMLGMEQKKESLHVETQKLDKKKNPNFGGKKEDNFTDKVNKTPWERGDSISFIDKSGKERLGRVIKVDKELNVTTIRQSNGLTETVSNSKIRP